MERRWCRHLTFGKFRPKKWWVWPVGICLKFAFEINNTAWFSKKCKCSNSYSAVFTSKILTAVILDDVNIELVSKELNQLAAILHVYAWGLIFMKWKKYYYSKREGKYFCFFNHFYSEKSSKRANSTNLLLATLQLL